MDIDFIKQTNITDKIIILRQLFERFNENHGNVIDMNLVEDAINNIVVIKEDLSNASSEAYRLLRYGAKGLCGDNKIYVKESVPLDTLFHETLHFISRESRGLVMPLYEAIGEEKIMALCEKYGENRVIEMLDQLNEAMTRYITELGIPEITPIDAYEFGALFFKAYNDKLVGKGLDNTFLLNMYIYGDQEAMNRFKDSFGDDLIDVLNNIEMWQNAFRYLTKPNMRPTLSGKDLDGICEKAVNNIKLK